MACKVRETLLNKKKEYLFTVCLFLFFLLFNFVYIQRVVGRKIAISFSDDGLSTHKNTNLSRQHEKNDTNKDVIMYDTDGKEKNYADEREGEAAARCLHMCNIINIDNNSNELLGNMLNSNNNILVRNKNKMKIRNMQSPGIPDSVHTLNLEGKLKINMREGELEEEKEAEEKKEGYINMVGKWMVSKDMNDPDVLVIWLGSLYIDSFTFYTKGTGSTLEKFEGDGGQINFVGQELKLKKRKSVTSYNSIYSNDTHYNNSSGYSMYNNNNYVYNTPMDEYINKTNVPPDANDANSTYSKDDDASAANVGNINDNYNETHMIYNYDMDLLNNIHNSSTVKNAYTHDNNNIQQNSSANDNSINTKLPYIPTTSSPTIITNTFNTESENNEGEMSRKNDENNSISSDDNELNEVLKASTKDSVIARGANTTMYVHAPSHNNNNTSTNINHNQMKNRDYVDGREGGETILSVYTNDNNGTNEDYNNVLYINNHDISDVSSASPTTTLLSNVQNYINETNAYNNIHVPYFAAPSEHDFLYTENEKRNEKGAEHEKTATSTATVTHTNSTEDRDVLQINNYVHTPSDTLPQPYTFLSSRKTANDNDGEDYIIAAPDAVMDFPPSFVKSYEHERQDSEEKNNVANTNVDNVEDESISDKHGVSAVVNNGSINFGTSAKANATNYLPLFPFPSPSPLSHFFSSSSPASSVSADRLRYSTTTTSSPSSLSSPSSYYSSMSSSANVASMITLRIDSMSLIDLENIVPLNKFVNRLLGHLGRVMQHGGDPRGTGGVSTPVEGDVRDYTKQTKDQLRVVDIVDSAGHIGLISNSDYQERKRRLMDGQYAAYNGYMYTYAADGEYSIKDDLLYLSKDYEMHNEDDVLYGSGIYTPGTPVSLNVRIFVTSSFSPSSSSTFSSPSSSPSPLLDFPAAFLKAPEKIAEVFADSEGPLSTDGAIGSWLAAHTSIDNVEVLPSAEEYLDYIANINTSRDNIGNAAHENHPRGRMEEKQRSLKQTKSSKYSRILSHIQSGGERSFTDFTFPIAYIPPSSTHYRRALTDTITKLIYFKLFIEKYLREIYAFYWGGTEGQMVYIHSKERRLMDDKLNENENVNNYTKQNNYEVTDGDILVIDTSIKALHTLICMLRSGYTPDVKYNSTNKHNSNSINDDTSEKQHEYLPYEYRKTEEGICKKYSVDFFAYIILKSNIINTSISSIHTLQNKIISLNSGSNNSKYETNNTYSDKLTYINEMNNELLYILKNVEWVTSSKKNINIFSEKSPMVLDVLYFSQILPKNVIFSALNIPRDLLNLFKKKKDTRHDNSTSGNINVNQQTESRHVGEGDRIGGISNNQNNSSNLNIDSNKNLFNNEKETVRLFTEENNEKIKELNNAISVIQHIAFHK